MRQRRRISPVALGIAALLLTTGVVATSVPAMAAPDDTTISQTSMRSGTAPNFNYTGTANTNSFLNDRTTTATLNGTANNAQGGFINLAIPGAATTSPSGRYRTMTNFWDTDMNWSCPRLITLFGANQPATTNCSTAAGDVDNTARQIGMNVDSETGAFNITNYTGQMYFPNGRTGVPNSIGANGVQTGTTCQNAAQTDKCHWTPNSFHFPATYPAVYKGCNFGQCSFQLNNGGIKASAGLPTPLGSLVSLKSDWHYTLPTGTVPNSGVFDVAYDIWLDRGTQNGGLPAGAGSLQQNDGAEIMIWANNHGYSPNNVLDATHLITPAGDKVESLITIPGADGTWDVWINRQANGSTTPWNIVTFVANPPLDHFTADTRLFLQKSMTYNSGDRPDVIAKLDASANPDVKASCPDAAAQVSGGVPVPRSCVGANWWLTSVQVGFEIWRLPTDGGASTGTKLGTTSFTVNPLTVLGDPAAVNNTGVTGTLHLNGDGTTKPTIHWSDTWKLSYSACSVNDTTTKGSYTIGFGNGGSVSGDLVQTGAGTGIWESVPSVQPTQPGHDDSTISVTLPCNGGNDNITNAPVFIDPSGKVVNQDGLPINGATVTLGLCAGAGSTVPCPTVDANSPLIQPKKSVETTPDSTIEEGSGPGTFRWDVQDGSFWSVTATAPGCNTVTLGPLPVAPAQVDLLLKLTCDASATGVVEPGGATRPPVQAGLPTVVRIRPGGNPARGYCADVFVTNNTSAPVEWNTSFNVPLNQQIEQKWNMTFTQGGNPNRATNVHADAGSQSWNKMLAAGATTHDVGFCTHFS
ncbi:cellulose binding domain-containing protein [Streptosporangiaceae bacterium NEAU-GS5]|nr:cellulose binding domain-containing protein [Streptosporangiaceae bacterium NEAU-GS5]